MSVEIRTGILHHVDRTGVSGCLALDGIAYHPKVFRRRRRGIVIKDGSISPGERKSRHSVPFEEGLKVIVWVDLTPGKKPYVLKFTSKTQYEAALARLNT